MSQPVKPYYSEGSKKEQVGKMFDNIAPSYDLLNRVLSLGIDIYWRKKAIALLKERKPKVILDVATGTGDVAIEMVKQLQPERIVGLDLANEMLEVGRKKIKSRNMDQVIEMVQGDSEKLPFQDNTFEAVTVAFGVRNFENLEQGLSEMFRVLKKDGQVVILEFSKPKMPPFKQLYNFYFKNILPLVGRITSKDPKAYSYLYESVQAFPDGERFEKILEKIGFKCTHTTALTLGICSIYYAEK
ncbi:MAG: bifunctional demethylmenaquinone methyltransferase/2-methoxy-6-polyprenyl-1,4-benzoquinol methylase UbiE [Saprospiraceae bacterium]